MFTVELYKKDSRTKSGERLVSKVDHDVESFATLEHLTQRRYPTSAGYRFEIHQTYVTKKNLMGGGEFTERYDTPYYCSPASESYWSM
jgi:hypothetical protein